MTKLKEIRFLLGILLILFIVDMFLYWISSINTFTETFVPATIILIANIFSRDYSSRRYEIITAIFGWTTAIFILAWLICEALKWYYLFRYAQVNQLILNMERITQQIFILSLITFLTRDYEKILKPNAIFIEDKIIFYYKKIIEVFKN